MKTVGSAAAVLATMRDEAQAEIERIERDADAIVARTAQDESLSIEAPDRADRLAAAARQRRERIAREDWEDRRVALELRETWMQEVVAAGRKLLETPDSAGARRALLRSLVEEAVQRLPPGVPATVSVASRDLELLDAELLGARLSAGPPERIRGGCIARAANLIVDNSFEERERRFEPDWRAALAKVYGP